MNPVAGLCKMPPYCAASQHGPPPYHCDGLEVPETGPVSEFGEYLGTGRVAIYIVPSDSYKHEDFENVDEISSFPPVLPQFDRAFLSA